MAVSGTIAVAGLRRARRLTLYEVRIEDGTGRLKALWFNQPFLKDTLPRGAQVVLYGTVEPDAYGSRQLMMSSPQYEKVESEDAAGRTHLLYDGSPYPELGAAIVRDGRYPNVAIALPHNDTAALWIRQTAPSRASWSIHELRLWRYDSSGGVR